MEHIVSVSRCSGDLLGSRGDGDVVGTPATLDNPITAARLQHPSTQRISSVQLLVVEQSRSTRQRVLQLSIWPRHRQGRNWGRNTAAYIRKQLQHMRLERAVGSVAVRCVPRSAKPQAKVRPPRRLLGRFLTTVRRAVVVCIPPRPPPTCSAENKDKINEKSPAVCLKTPLFRLQSIAIESPAVYRIVGKS